MGTVDVTSSVIRNPLTVIRDAMEDAWGLRAATHRASGSQGLQDLVASVHVLVVVAEEWSAAVTLGSTTNINRSRM